MSSDLVQEYKRDKVSRKDWETGYTKGLDLLGFEYTEMTRPSKVQLLLLTLVGRGCNTISSTSV